MTELQRDVLARVQSWVGLGLWFRAEHPGQRVTLASLYRKGLLVRRVRRGKDGDPDAAYEYTTASGGLAR